MLGFVWRPQRALDPQLISNSVQQRSSELSALVDHPRMRTEPPSTAPAGVIFPRRPQPRRDAGIRPLIAVAASPQRRAEGSALRRARARLAKLHCRAWHRTKLCPHSRELSAKGLVTSPVVMRQPRVRSCQSRTPQNLAGRAANPLALPGARTQSSGLRSRILHRTKLCRVLWNPG